jgi:hypothetical protein
MDHADSSETGVVRRITLIARTVVVTREGGTHLVLRKDKVEIGNSELEENHGIPCF